MLEITYKEEPEVLTVILKGSLTAKTALVFEDALEKASNSSKKQVVLHCAQLSTFSSRGIGLLMIYLPYFEDLRISLTLESLCPKIYYVLHMLGMDRYMLLQVRESNDLTS